MGAARPLLNRQPFPPDRLDQVVLGCVQSGPDEANVARIAALRLGCGDRVPAWTVQRNCASGLQAVVSGAQDIAVGRAELVLAGGTEAMSRHPLLLSHALVAWLAQWTQARGTAEKVRALARLRPGYLKPVVALVRGLTDPIVGLSMGQTAEELAFRFRIGREEMDAYAVESHRRLGLARKSDGLAEEIEPLFDSDGHVYAEDEGYRPDTNMAQLAQLKPAFDRPVGRVTAGNSAQITDGAALLLLASDAAVERYRLPTLARIVDHEWAALSPAEMGLGPVHAMAALLLRRGLTTGDLDLWEINEAFAAQILACQRAWTDPGYVREGLGLDRPFDPIPVERLNPDGGAIGIGHPVGASGARILLHLARSLQACNGKRGIASLCVGGGQGGALLLEREEG